MGRKKGRRGERREREKEREREKREKRTEREKGGGEEKGNRERIKMARGGEWLQGVGVACLLK